MTDDHEPYTAGAPTSPGGGSPGVRASRSVVIGRSRATVALDVDGADDDPGLHHPGVGVGQVVPDQRGEDQLHQHGAGHRADDADSPPASGVPPTTTAVIALSSISSPTNDGSCAGAGARQDAGHRGEGG